MNTAGSRAVVEATARRNAHKAQAEQREDDEKLLIYLIGRPDLVKTAWRQYRARQFKRGKWPQNGPKVRHKSEPFKPLE